MTLLIALKVLFTFTTVLFTISNIVKIVAKNYIPAINFVWQAIGVTGLITIFFLI